MKTERSLARGAGEFMLIVVGVVAALVVDRWVQGLDDAAAESQYLALVQADVEANLEIFRRMSLDWEAASDATADLMAAVESRERPSDSGLLMAVARAGTVNTVPARDASFRDLESTGNLRLISDQQLRSRIVEYFTQTIRFGRPMIEERSDLRFRTFAREWVPSSLANHRGLCPLTARAFDCDLSDPPSTETLWTALTSDPGVLRVLNSRHADALAGAGVIQQWLEQTEALREALMGSRVGADDGSV